jgi:hypothetical protein
MVENHTDQGGVTGPGTRYLATFFPTPGRSSTTTCEPWIARQRSNIGRSGRPRLGERAAVTQGAVRCSAHLTVAGLGNRLVLSKVSQQLGAVSWNLRADSVNDDEPILVVLGVETAKCLAPRKLALSEQVGADDALVKGTAHGVVWCVGLVEGMRMSDQNGLNAAIAVGNSLDFEGSVTGWMDAEDVLSPAGNRKLRMGARILDVTRRKRLMWTESKAVGKYHLTGNWRNHGLSFSGRA